MKVIYCIENEVNGKCYIGSAVDFKRRRREHLNKLRKGIHHSYFLQKSWDKYGEVNFRIFILEIILDVNDLIIREQWWIDNITCDYNMCKTAGNSLGLKRRPETIEKVRRANLGLKHPDWRNKIKSQSQGGENHWAYGKKFTDSTKNKKSESMKKYHQENSHMRNTVILEYTLDDIFVKEWSSLKEAGIYYNINPDSISNNLRGRSKSAGNKKWKYK